VTSSNDTPVASSIDKRVCLVDRLSNIDGNAICVGTRFFYLITCPRRENSNPNANILYKIEFLTFDVIKASCWGCSKILELVILKCIKGTVYDKCQSEDCCSTIGVVVYASVASSGANVKKKKITTASC
jgi:hypothetical protein